MSTKTPKKHEGTGWRPDKRHPGKKIFYARITWMENGKRRAKEKTARNITHAKELREKMLADLRGHGSNIFEGEKLTFGDLAEQYKEKYLIEPVYVGDMKIAGQRSWENQRGFLKPLIAFFGTKYLNKITYEDLTEYRKVRFETPVIEERGGGQRSVASVNRELSLLRSIFKYAYRSGLITRSPFEMGESVISLAAETERNRIMTADEEVRFLSVCRESLQRLHLYYLVVVALETAGRFGELHRLAWSDINPDKGLITLTSYKGKLKRSRTIGLTARAKLALGEWHQITKGSDPVFLGIKGINKSFGRVCAAAKIADLTFHDLRHTATTRMIEAGIPPMEVMKITGHTQMKTFARYINLYDELVRRQAEKLDAAREERESSSESSSESWVN